MPFTFSKMERMEMMESRGWVGDTSNFHRRIIVILSVLIVLHLLYSVTDGTSTERISSIPLRDGGRMTNRAALQHRRPELFYSTFVGPSVDIRSANPSVPIFSHGTSDDPSRGLIYTH